MDKDNEIRLFVRFLKELKINKRFCKEYYSKEGKEFRHRESEIIVYGYIQDDISNVDLFGYLKIVPSSNFIIHAFNWHSSEWVDWDRIWYKHLKWYREKKKLGKI